MFRLKVTGFVAPLVGGKPAPLEAQIGFPDFHDLVEDLAEFRVLFREFFHDFGFEKLRHFDPGSDRVFKHELTSEQLESLPPGFQRATAAGPLV